MSSPYEEFLLGDTNAFAQSYLNASMRGSGSVGGKPNLSIDRAALELTGYNASTLAPDPGWGPAGQTYTVTYAFRASAPATMPSGTSAFERFNAQQITQAEQSLLSWSDVANIRFTRVGQGTTGEAAYSNSATILFSNYSNSDSTSSSAFAYFPGSTAATANAGDVWVNIKSGSNITPSIGTYAAQTLTHEIGHAIGLNHPGDYDAHDGLPFSYQNDAEYFEDSRQYTVMSYFNESNTGGAYGGKYASAPQLDDIRAAQLEYGANMTTRTGDTVYGFGSTADRAWFNADSAGAKIVFAVWDAGGRDTFNFSGFSQNQVIDLREGHFSDVGGLVGNVAIAQGTQIENAIGGSGNDTIYGNALANRIEAGAGDDKISGEAGADTIYGGAGADTVDAGDGTNLVFGEEGDDVLFGGIDSDTLQGNQGDDTISGGWGADVLYGGQGNDHLYGDDGNDFINGNLGDDTVLGGAGNDTILGGQGDDHLSGGGGNDYLVGDRGNDTLVGGIGADRFRGTVGGGVDRIVDFSRAEGDQILLDAGIAYTATESGSDTIIAFGPGADQFILVGVSIASLTDGWIVGV